MDRYSIGIQLYENLERGVKPIKSCSFTFGEESVLTDVINRLTEIGKDILFHPDSCVKSELGEIKKINQRRLLCLYHLKA